MEVNLMHAGEEIFYVLIPAFVIYMLVDFARKRKLRAKQTTESPPESSTSPEDVEVQSRTESDP